MKCPYCNNDCACRYVIYICLNCPYYPSFIDWSKDDLCVVGEHLEVRFQLPSVILPSKIVIFNPNTCELYIEEIESIFHVNYLINPNNIKDTVERLLKLKAFS